jgi:NDP-sugar pyrophosphorylase family protein
MTDKSIRQIPLVDDDGVIVSVEHKNLLLNIPQNSENWVVIMAGGLGTRLRPLTDELPKPMIKIGGKPLLESIIEKFIAHGFNNFYISVNFKADLIKEYFGDGHKINANIKYLEEDEPLGTAGALGLLPEKPNHPFIVMNGDLLTNINFNHLLDFHEQYDTLCTVCVREYKNEIPFGVVEVEDSYIQDIVEKPVQEVMVNSGIYVISPDVLDLVPKKTFIEMPTLLQQITKDGRKCTAFPIHEYWLDIGRIDDLEKAQHEFLKVIDG